MPLILNGTTGISGVDGSAGTPSYVGADTDTGVLFPAANTLALSTGGTERVRVDSSGNVGIGTSSPSSYYATQLVVNGGADGGITVVNTTTGDARLMFADGTAGDARYAGQIVYNHGNNYMMFGTNGGNERMRITSGGSLLFGTTDSIANITSSSGTGLALYNSSGNTQFLASNANDNVIQANRQGTDGAIIALRKAGTVAGTIDVTATGVTYTGTNGITFTATQTASAGANTLDDYEEGTWTPSFASTGGGESLTYTGQRTGRYTKIGRVVYFQFDVELSAKSGGSGTARITGFPFTSENAPVTGGGTSIYWASTTTYAPAFGNIVLNTTVMDIRYGTVTDAQLFPWANITATTRLLMFGFYTVP